MVSPTNRMEIARCVRVESAEKDFEGITGLILNLSYFCSHALYGPQRCPLVEAEEQIVIHGEVTGHMVAIISKASTWSLAPLGGRAV
jgi:hypothetical protein